MHNYSPSIDRDRIIAYKLKLGYLQLGHCYQLSVNVVNCKPYNHLVTTFGK